MTKGIMLATIRILSTIAELTAENHKVVIAIVSMSAALGFVNKIIPSERFEIKPTLMTPPTIIKRPIKKKSVGHSKLQSAPSSGASLSGDIFHIVHA
jgi:hypothetical protein